MTDSMTSTDRPSWSRMVRMNSKTGVAAGSLRAADSARVGIRAAHSSRIRVGECPVSCSSAKSVRPPVSVCVGRLELVSFCDLADREDVPGCRADGFECMNRCAFGAVADSEHLDDPFAGLEFERFAFKLAWWASY